MFYQHNQNVNFAARSSLLGDHWQPVSRWSLFWFRLVKIGATRYSHADAERTFIVSPITAHARFRDGAGASEPRQLAMVPHGMNTNSRSGAVRMLLNGTLRRAQHTGIEGGGTTALSRWRIKPRHEKRQLKPGTACRFDTQSAGAWITTGALQGRFHHGGCSTHLVRTRILMFDRRAISRSLLDVRGPCSRLVVHFHYLRTSLKSIR